MFSGTKALAGWPTFDAANLAAEMSGNLEEAYNWAEEKAMNELDMQMRAFGLGEELTVEEKAAAKTIVSINKAKQEIQNLEIEMAFSPGLFACDTAENTKQVEEIACEAEADKEDLTEALAEKNGDFEEKPAETIEKIAEVAKDIVEQCIPAKGDDASKCLQLGMLLGDGAEGSTDKELEEIAEATAYQVELLSGVLPVKKTDPRLPDTPTANIKRSGDLRYLAYKALIDKSLIDVRGDMIHFPDTPASFINTLKEFTDQRWGDKGTTEWMKLVMASHPKKSEGKEFNMGPEQVEREMAVIQAFQAYMAVLQYEQSLQVQTLQAALLAITLEPIKR